MLVSLHFFFWQLCISVKNKLLVPIPPPSCFRCQRRGPLPRAAPGDAASRRRPRDLVQRPALADDVAGSQGERHVSTSAGGSPGSGQVRAQPSRPPFLPRPTTLSLCRAPPNLTSGCVTATQALCKSQTRKKKQKKNPQLSVGWSEAAERRRLEGETP